MLSIVVPAYNEEENIPVLIERIEKVFRSNKIKGEIVIVNDNSTDKTSKVANRCAKSYGNVVVVDRTDGLRGPGRALREGFRHANGSVVITMDADLSHEPEEIPNFLQALKQADVISGSRYMKGGSGELDPLRNFISRGYSLFAKLLLGLNMADISTGYRAIRKNVLEKLDLQSTGFEIHAEIPAKACLNNFRIKEIPIHYAKRRKGKTKLKYLKEGKRYFKVIIKAFLQKISLM